MNRLAGIIVAAAGLIIAVVSILKVIPGFSITNVGVMMILLGGLIIGLSFVGGPESDESGRMSTASTLVNIFFSPTEVFQNLRRHPRWFVAVLIMTILSGLYSNLFLQRLGAERVANYAIDKTLEMPMIANNEQARKQVEDGRAQAIADTKNPVTRIGQSVGTFFWLTVGFTVLALIFMLFAMAMGGKINFWQAFSVAVYAWFPASIIKTVLNLILLYIKDPTDIHPIIGQGSLVQDNLNFLVTPKDNPVVWSFLGALSLLWFYWLWLNSTGLKNGGERVSSSVAWTTSIGIYLIVIILGVVSAFLFPSFIS
jgi:hypothetical protein